MHVWSASGQIQLQSNIFSMHFVCLLGLTNFLDYSQLSLCSLHKYLSWETAQLTYSTTYMATFIIWQWYPLLYFPCTSYARCCFQLLYSIAILSTLGLQFFTTRADTLWKASVEMSQPFLKMKWEMQLQGPTKDIRVPQWDSSKQREDSNSINCHSCFPGTVS